MSPLTRRFALALSLVTAAATAIACGAPVDDGASSADEAVTTEGDFYGNDRVGAVLKGHPEKVPASFDGFEKTFGVGRACARKDSKEIFIVEESQTRGVDVKVNTLLPRAVISGCNTGDLSDPNSAKTSYSLFAALVSDPGMHQATQGDTMRMWPLEVMALDQTTGQYNFYVFEPAVTPGDRWAPLPANTPGKVARVFRTKDAVLERRLEAGKAVTPDAPPADGTDRCFRCHVNGAPLMNEMRDPWTNWVSFKKALPSSTLFQTTKELVTEAVPSSTTGRSSLANDFEPIMRAAIQGYVFGTTPTGGWANATVAGTQPGSIKRMLEAVFCETELNYGTAGQTVPIEVFFDPDVINGTDITPPPSFGSKKIPFEFPIRSTFDQQTESWLVDRKFLSIETVKAIRLLDDENDIFSPARCGYLAEVTKNLIAEPTKVQAQVRKVLTSKLGSLPFTATQPKRAAFLKALLSPNPVAGIDVLETDYLAELVARFKAADTSDAAILTKDALRKKLARAKFPNPANPLPVLDAPQ